MIIYRILIPAMLLCPVREVYSQNFWHPAGTEGDTTVFLHKEFRNQDQVAVFELDGDQISRYLENAPEEFTDSFLELEIPTPEGGTEIFHVFHSSVMMKGLQSKYPAIRSFKGYSADRKKNIRFTLSPAGFHGYIRSLEGLVIIEPSENKSADRYLVYYYSNQIADFTGQLLSCGTDAGQNEMDRSAAGSLKSFSDPVELRIYRLALACTGEWGAANGGDVLDVLIVMVNSVTLLNQIFENDLAIRLLLINQNDQVIWVNGATDPYMTPNNGNTLLAENTNIINNAIGFSAYDIGHVYTRGCTDTGGIAFIRSACVANKGGGVTCHSNNNINAVTLNIAAHEFGHQFGANHSFNNCDGNENFGTAYEPGSGSTIMSYAGLCGSNNVQAVHDGYFHSISVDEITNYTRLGTGNTCPQKMATGNTNPVAKHEYENGFFIPVETPFELTGQASDAEDPGNLTYAWEQINLGPESTLGQPLDDAPSFRAIEPDTITKRVFPRLTSVINNTSDITEVLPTSGRNFSFRFVVRDNHEDGGGISWKSVNFAATGMAGPFKVLFPNHRDTLTIGEEIELEWDVAQTDQNPVNCENVEILISLDGGLTYPVVLKDLTTNDGFERVIVPNLPTNRGRIKIKAADNVFFDISNANFVIEEPSEPGYFIDPLTPGSFVCSPSVIEIPILTNGFQDYDELIDFEIVGGIPEGATAEFIIDEVPVNDTAVLLLDLTGVEFSGTYNLEIRSVSTAEDTLFRIISIDVVSTLFEPIELQSPANGSSGVKGLPVFSWSESAQASGYEYQLATNPSFEERFIVDQQFTDLNEYIPSSTLAKNELYFWRVRSNNSCGNSKFSEVAAFHTETVGCQSRSSEDTPVNISASGTRTVESVVDITEGGQVQDVNIIKIMGTHEQVSDLKISLISPSGTQVVVFNRLCGNLANFDMGFDDDAPADIQCPVTGGVTFRPLESLNAFEGEDALGTWTLRIEDQSPGFGGALNQFMLEICTDLSLDPPVLVNNSPLETPPLIVSRIKDDLLLTEDPDNTPDELVYTLVTLPIRGALTLNGGFLGAGSQFTQANINRDELRYVHSGGGDPTDEFLFVVEDGEGGWIEMTRFQILIDEDFTSSVEEVPGTVGIRIYPSPVSDILNIRFDETLQSPTLISLYDLSGRLQREFTMREGDREVELDVTSLMEGMFILHVQSDIGRIVRKVIVH